MRAIAALGAMLLLLSPALADTVSDRPDKVRVTLYHSDGIETDFLVHRANYYDTSNGLAFITEERTVDVPAGPGVIRFRGVAATMVPQSADIDGLPAGAIERNFDYDLISPGALLAKSVGRTVHIVRTDPVSGARKEQSAIVRLGENGAMLEIDGRLEALRCSGLPERIVFDSLPEGLADTPTLSVRTLSPVAARYHVKLTYLATGLNWAADYVGRISPDGETLDVSGKITIANFGSTGFARVPIDIVAGKLNKTGDDSPIDPRPARFAPSCWPMKIDWATHRPLQTNYTQTVPVAISVYNSEKSGIETVIVTAEKRSQEGIDPRVLGDYKLYPLPEPTGLGAMETKEVQFLNARGMRFKKHYSLYVGSDFDNWEEGTEPAGVMYRLDNDKTTGVARAFPAGFLSIETPGPDGIPIFLGQGSVSDTPEGLPVETWVGSAIDVDVERQLAKEEKIDRNGVKVVRRTIIIAVSNSKPIAVDFELFQGLFATRIVSEPAAHGFKFGAAFWGFPVKAGETRTFEYTIERSREY